jgi:hypothetical protein
MMTKLYLASIPFTLDAHTMAEAGYDTANTHDLEARRDLKDVLVRGLHSLIESGRANEHDIILCKALLSHKEVAALRGPRSSRSIPGLVLETLIRIGRREQLETIEFALDRHDITCRQVPGALQLGGLGLWSRSDAWTLVHLLDGVYDEALQKGL